MSDVVDLDALVPIPVTVKFNEQLIEISPPKTGDIMRLGVLGQKMETISVLSEDETTSLINDLTLLVQKIVPQLAGKDFTTAQLLKLVEIISTMAMPPDTKELQERGITSDTPKKAQ